MRTAFTEVRLRDPGNARAGAVQRTRVHRGFRRATCPAFRLAGDGSDSLRGRISLIEDVLGRGRPADAGTTGHIDRRPSCRARAFGAIAEGRCGGGDPRGDRKPGLGA